MEAGEEDEGEGSDVEGGSELDEAEMSEGEMEGGEEEQALAMTGVGGKIEASKVGPVDAVPTCLSDCFRRHQRSDP